MLARRGARVALAGRTLDQLAEVAEGIGGAGGTAITVTCDVSDEDSVRSAIETTVETWGRLDVVVANAGVNGRWAGIDDLAVEDFRSTLDINLVATFITIKYAVPHLRRRGGSVIVTSSVNGTRMFSNSGASAYSASKAGQVALAKMLAVELAPDKIRVNAICPGAIDTEISDNTDADNADVKIPVEYPEGHIPLTGGKPGSAEQVGETTFAVKRCSGTPGGLRFQNRGRVCRRGPRCASTHRSSPMKVLVRVCAEWPCTQSSLTRCRLSTESPPGPYIVHACNPHAQVRTQSTFVAQPQARRLGNCSVRPDAKSADDDVGWHLRAVDPHGVDVTVCCGDEPLDLGLGTHVDAHAFHGFMHQATHTGSSVVMGSSAWTMTRR
jgi:NAD(P)-dependent dehydrogenase (short-subunit alcohol dehydrogenase family)